MMITPPWNPELEKVAVEELADDLLSLCVSVRAAALDFDFEPASSYPGVLPFEHLA